VVNGPNIFQMLPVFYLGCVLVNCMEQITNFTIVGGTAKHCVDQYMVSFRYCSLGGANTMLALPWLCHAFLV